MSAFFHNTLGYKSYGAATWGYIHTTVRCVTFNVYKCRPRDSCKLVAT